MQVGNGMFHHHIDICRESSASWKWNILFLSIQVQHRVFYYTIDVGRKLEMEYIIIIFKLEMEYSIIILMLERNVVPV